MQAQVQSSGNHPQPFEVSMNLQTHMYAYIHTWIASSRVGSITMARGLRPRSLDGFFFSSSMRGRAKPRVLPVPVRA